MTPKQQPPTASAMMACDEAFRTLTRQYLHRLIELHRRTCIGDSEALHEMRIALTRLRTSIRFFSPMVSGADQVRISRDLKWLNAHLGVVRDLDVALERLSKSGRQPGAMTVWKHKRTACQRRLARALRSHRYHRLIDELSAWIETGAWSTKRGERAASLRQRPIGEYSAEKLTKWRNKLVKKSGTIEEVGARKRHRVRLINKKLTYALDALTSLVPDDKMPAREAALKQLRKAQRSLGQLNDDARYRALAGALRNGKVPAPALVLGHKRKKHLLHKAAGAYREFARLAPFQIRPSSRADKPSGTGAATND